MRLRSLSFRVLVFVLSTAVALGLAEWIYRGVAPGPSRPFYLDAERQPIDFANPDPAQAPIMRLEPTVPAGRVRNSFEPGALFYICYDGPEGPGFDEFGCVEVRINSRGVRDREELCAPKPEGQRRVLCVGDSFTFGWGVRAEDGWVRRVESALRADDDGVRTVNCGASGALFVDEYAVALRERFVAFEPDAVVVTLCLNDLIPSFQVLSHRRPLPWMLRHSRLCRDLFAGWAVQHQLAVDPGIDLVAELLAIPPPLYVGIPWLAPTGVGHAEMWAGGGPQSALRSMRDWCGERGVAFGVVIWPYLQGLGPGVDYPFATIHRLVAEFCVTESIPFHDVLPALREVPAAELWVHPSDFHANARAQALAAPGISDFIRQGLLR